MRIEKIKITNYKGIEHFEGDIKGANVYLIGANESGKTSFIDAIFCGVTGKNLPSEPVTKGNKRGEIEIDLGEFIAVTKFTKGKATQFTLQNKEFTKETEKFVSSPRNYLNSRVGILDFDINDFFSKSDAEQVKYFCKYSGLDFTDIDANIEEISESRKADKKTLTILQSKITHYKKEDAEKELVDVIKASKEIAAAKEKIETVNGIRKGVVVRESRILEIDNLIENLIKERDGYTDENGNVVKGLKHEIKDAVKWFDLPENKVLTPEELKVLEDAFDKLEETNTTIKDAKAGKEVDEDIKKIEKAIEQANEDIQKAKEDKTKKISENITIEGLEYSTEHECFLWNGLPFEKNQINTASQLIAGLKIGSMMLKDLRILKIDASLIDKKQFQKVLDWAEENSIELFIELVDREAEALRIEIDEY